MLAVGPGGPPKFMGAGKGLPEHTWLSDVRTAELMRD